MTVFFDGDVLANIENYLSFSKDHVKPKPAETTPDAEKTKPDDAEAKKADQW